MTTTLTAEATAARAEHATKVYGSGAAGVRALDEISVTIPAGCMGTDITARASLVDINGADLNPAVASTITITVN